MQVRKSGYACWLLTSISFFSACFSFAQNTEPQRMDIGDKNEIVVLSSAAFDANQPWASDGFSIVKLQHENRYRYEAKTSRGTVRSSWIDPTQNTAWMVYSVRKHKFQNLHNWIFVTVSDEGALSTLAERLGVRSVNTYAHVDYAKLVFDYSDDLETILGVLRNTPAVKNIGVEEKGLINVPM